MGVIVGIQAVAQDGSGEAPPGGEFAGDPNFPAPAFPEGVAWLNVEAPLTMEDLRGKVVLLDFWTYGCINCIHMIPVLKQLEAKYGDALAVIGVHSAKFDNEGQTDNIRQIVQRYGLEHPVINDGDFTVWNTYGPYGVNAWPTFVVIDPRGNLFAVQGGEIPFDAFDQVVGGMIGYFDSAGEINRDPLPLVLEGATEPNAALSFPGKVLADATSGRLFIADSSHNRLVITDLNTYEVLDVIGTGAAGWQDGAYEEALFNKPQGMALRGDTLYIADTDNHRIRAVDLLARTVTTIAGTGFRSFDFSSSGLPLETDLASPWDLEFGDDENLYIAMAGMHQIWVLSFNADSVGPIVGSGREGLVDGALSSAELAQPSGLYFRDNVLYFADSESSSIRAADFTTREVRTLAGPPMDDLFTFGDVDGGFGDSRLQHPLGVVGGEDGLLYVTDTYNSKIKLLDPSVREISTLFGLGGTGGFQDGEAAAAAFDEPGGLDYANGKLYIADTNNDAIRVIDLATNTVSTVTFTNAAALQISGQVTIVGGNSAGGETIQFEAQTVAAGAGEIVLNIALPEGYKLNNLAPFTADWASDNAAVTIGAEDAAQSILEPELPIHVPVTLTEGNAMVTGDLTIYYCEAVNESLCFIDRVTVQIPVTVGADGTGSEITLERAIIPPQVPTGGIG
ncbi:MAG: redoxin domain-containing protein [Anaerolineae bacterium]|nr:redoxin domain-containing protein [Anaerolineae bacterium]